MPQNSSIRRGWHQEIRTQTILLLRSGIAISPSRTSGHPRPGENSISTGTTYMRIRGAAGSRINVTLDGVALNSPGRPDRFWANMNQLFFAPEQHPGTARRRFSHQWRRLLGGSISMATAAPLLTPTSSYRFFRFYNTYHRRQLLYRSARQASDFWRCLSRDQLPNRLCRRYSRPLRFLLWRTDLAER